MARTTADRIDYLTTGYGEIEALRVTRRSGSKVVVAARIGGDWSWSLGRCDETELTAEAERRGIRLLGL